MNFNVDLQGFYLVKYFIVRYVDRNAQYSDL